MKVWPQLIACISLLAVIGCTEDAEEKVLTTQSTGFQLFHGGPIYTMDTSAPEVEAVVFSDNGRITYAGQLKTARSIYPRAERFDLQGKTMMPGFIEQHLHPFLGAVALSIAVIAPEAWVLPEKTWPAATTADEYLTALRTAEADMEDDQEVFWSWGFNQYFHGELNRAMLDEISDSRPMGIWHRSAHEFYVNSAFIKHFGLEQTDIDQLGAIVQAQSNLESGHFYETGALIYLLPRIFAELGNEERFREGLHQMVAMLHRRGVTAFNEPGAFIPPHMVQAFGEILGSPQTPMYSFFTPESKTLYQHYGAEGVLAAAQKVTETYEKEGKIRFFDKQIKILFDGAIISLLMQMKDGYEDGHQGEWIQPPEEAATLFQIFWDAGYQIHVHVNGDEGLEQMIAIIEENMERNPRRDHRTTIVHFANSTTEQVQRLSELGALISANPYYVTGFAEKFAKVGLGEERAYAMVRLGEAEKRGMSISLHSDMPMAPSDPLFLAWSAATRIGAESGEAIRQDLVLSRQAALRAITIDAAYSWGMETKLGSIEAGKIANFTILKEDPYQVPIELLKDIEVTGTVFEGRYFPVRH
jgi:predicted amidohydrolase YtcJ